MGLKKSFVLLAARGLHEAAPAVYMVMGMLMHRLPPPPSSSPLHTRSTVNFEKIGVEVGDEWGVVGAPRHKLAMPAAAGETGSACCREPRHRPQRCRRHVG